MTALRRALPLCDREWVERAACRDADPDLFMPTEGANGYDVADAKQVCGGCGVREECLRYALDNSEDFGIWGGLTARERRRLRRTEGAA